MWPFKKKIVWELEYALNLYEGLVAHNDLGEITVLSLRIPAQLHHAYEAKMLLQREMMCFVALMEVANPKSGIQSVLMAFGDLVAMHLANRGLSINRDQLAEAATRDVEKMLVEPGPWAQRWLAEFRSDPNDNFMVFLFADHCTRLYNTFKTSIESTRPK